MITYKIKAFVGITALLLISTLAAQSPRFVDANVLKAAGTATDSQPGTWLNYGLSQAETRYSPLNQINASNVSKLGLSWTYVLGAGGGPQEGTPLMWNNTIYGATTYSVVFAVDARTGKELWHWDPEVNQSAVRPKMCCGVVNRGIALSNGMIFVPVNDGRLVALDALNGKVKWESRVAYPQDWFSLTIAPRVAGNKVVVGVAGGEHPIRGFIDAFDVATGKHAWRFYTVPGDPAKGFEDEAQRAAAKTWGGEWWKMGGGGSVWDGMAYDSETNTVFAGTGNTEPWVEKFRGPKGLDNLYACSIVALDANTGKLKWYYQTVPNDNWDLDSVGGLMLADLKIKGRTRKVIMQAPKNGVFYVLDRVTGEFISANPFVQINWATGWDEKTGRAFLNKDAFYFSAADQVSDNPAQHTGFNFGRPNGAKPLVPAIIGPEPLEGQRTALGAWDPVKKDYAWRVPGGGASGGGTISTAGNLVIQVLPNGHLLAYSADKGEKLLDVASNRNGAAAPITYMVDGKQYVAFMAGSGKPANQVGPTDAKVDNPPLLFVYELGGTTAPPPPPAAPAKPFAAKPPAAAPAPDQLHGTGNNN